MDQILESLTTTPLFSRASHTALRKLSPSGFVDLASRAARLLREWLFGLEQYTST